MSNETEERSSILSVFEAIQKDDFEKFADVLFSNWCSKLFLQRFIVFPQSVSCVVHEFLAAPTFDINCKNEKGVSILFQIGKYKRIKFLQLMVFCVELDVNIQNNDHTGDSALHFACRRNHISTISILAKHPSLDFNLLNYRKESPLHILTRKGYTEAFQYFPLQDINLNVQNKNGDSPLICACKNGDMSIISILLEAKDECVKKIIKEEFSGSSLNEEENFNINYRHNCKINTVNKNKETALHCAILEKHPEVIRTLIENKIDINMQDEHGDTALHLATKNSHVDILKLFMNVENLDINIKNNNDYTVFYLALKAGYENLIQLLSTHPNLDFNLKCQGETYLHLSLRLANRSMSEFLFPFSNIEISTDKGYSTLFLASRYGDFFIAERIMHIIRSQNNNSPEIILEFLNQRNFCGSALHPACRKGYFKMVQFLLYQNIDLQIVNKYKFTALEWAERYEHTNIVSLIKNFNSQISL